MFPNWNWTLIAVSASFHGVAILTTLFRLGYRWYTGRMWWDDALAALAFLADIACLVVTLLEVPVPDNDIPRFFMKGNLILSFAFLILMWAARTSILAAIVRVSQPEGKPRSIALGVAVSFGLMGATMLALRIQTCIADECLMSRPLLIAQTTTDCIADVLLSVLPICFLSSVKLSRHRRILIVSALSASMVINVVTVMEAVVCFQQVTTGSIIFDHVKVASAMIVCNLLVIVTFVYLLSHKGNASMEDSIIKTDKIEFTTVDVLHAEISQDQEDSHGKSSVPSRLSTWSFHGGGRSKNSTSVVTDASRIDEENP